MEYTKADRHTLKIHFTSHYSFEESCEEGNPIFKAIKKANPTWPKEKIWEEVGIQTIDKIENSDPFSSIAKPTPKDFAVSEKDVLDTQPMMEMYGDEHRRQYEGAPITYWDGEPYIDGFGFGETWGDRLHKKLFGPRMMDNPIYPRVCAYKKALATWEAKQKPIDPSHTTDNQLSCTNVAAPSVVIGASSVCSAHKENSICLDYDSPPSLFDDIELYGLTPQGKPDASPPAAIISLRPEDFGVTANDVQHATEMIEIKNPHRENALEWSKTIGFFGGPLLLCYIMNVFHTPGLGLFALVFLVGSAASGAYLVYKLADKMFQNRLEVNPVYCVVRAYKKAQAEYDKNPAETIKRLASQNKVIARRLELIQRELAEKPWRSMDGWQFEKSIAELYREQGYSAEVTPGSGDHGVDIKLRGKGQYFVVQCKQQNTPVSPHIVRDLYGVMHSERADGAILVCTSGFSSATVDWTNGKPIQLVDMSEILQMERDTL